MKPAHKRANVGLTLVILFLITFVTGVILHLKKHGIVVEPRPLIKMFHWIVGFFMIVFTCWHGCHFWKMFLGMKQRVRWFWCDTWLVILLASAVFITGAVKLFSPVKIPHLGLWHYDLGIVLAIGVVFHLIRGLPAWRRLMKA